MTKVTVWQQLDGQVVFQKESLFFKVPVEMITKILNSGKFRKQIAVNFDSAPFKTKSFELLGAIVVVDEIEV